MKTKTIPCPCCAIDLKTPLRGGPKTIICPICKMRVEDPDGVATPINHEGGMRAETRRTPPPERVGRTIAQPRRKRSSSAIKGFYVCWTLLCLAGNGLTIHVCAFIAMFHDLPFHHPVSLAAILLLLSIPCYAGIFLHKKWGVYGYCSGNLIAAFLLLAIGNGEICLIGFIILLGVVIFISLLNAGENPPANRIFPAKSKAVGSSPS